MREQNITVYGENIRTVNICVDDEVIWANDEGIGGLYTIDKSTFIVNNILTPFQIFKFGKFEVRAIFQKNDSIVIVPCELNRNWIIYNKINGELQYLHLTKRRWKTSGFYKFGEKGILLPLTIEDPIIEIDLETISIVRVIENWGNALFKEKRDFVVWSSAGLVADGTLFFHLQNTKYFVRIKQKSMDKCMIEMPYGIRSMAYSNDKFWILPIDGSSLYVANAKGVVLEKVELITNEQQSLASDFIKIIATKEYVLLLPYREKKFCIYDIQKKYIFVINIERDRLKNKFPLQCNTASYWEYYIENNKIYFMPIENKLLVINLETLEWEEEDAILPSVISEHKLWYWFEWNTLRGEEELYKELREDSLGLYCKVIGEFNYSCLNKDPMGREIWRKLR